MKREKNDEFNQLNIKKTIVKHEYEELQSEYMKISKDLLEAKSIVKKNEEYF